MASLSKDAGGRKRIVVKSPDGKRRPIRLGKMSLRDAQSILTRIRALESAAFSGIPWDTETAAWVGSRTDTFYGKLAAVGLVPKREKETLTETLGEFLNAYIGSRAKLKPNTKRNYEVTRKHLIDYFGCARLLTEISPGDADEWRESLRKKLSAATVSREVKRARQFFRAAMRKRLMGENPFADIPTPAQVNATREHFVEPAIIEKVIEACPDAEWRLIVALSRYGGLRCPSEHLGLKWGDVNWERGRVTIRSPKTEHHTGGESRVIPLFPELRPHLEAVFFDEERAGTEYIITRYRDRNANLRTQFLRIIDRAGVDPWPKLFHNLRASRQTELTAQFPLYVVCAWLGNSAPIADKHYLTVTDSHYTQAMQGGAPGGTRLAQKAAKPTSAHICHHSQETTQALAGKGIGLVMAEAGEYCTNVQVPPRGVEPLSSD